MALRLFSKGTDEHQTMVDRYITLVKLGDNVTVEQATEAESLHRLLKLLKPMDADMRAVTVFQRQAEAARQIPKARQEAEAARAAYEKQYQRSMDRIRKAQADLDEARDTYRRAARAVTSSISQLKSRPPANSVIVRRMLRELGLPERDDDPVFDPPERPDDVIQEVEGEPERGSATLVMHNNR